MRLEELRRLCFQYLYPERVQALKFQGFLKNVSWSMIIYAPPYTAINQN